MDEGVNKNQINTRWIKSLILYSLFLAILITFILHLAGVSLIFIPLVFVLITVMIFIFSYLDFLVDAKFGQGVTFIFNKFILENQLKIGSVDKSGQVLFSWSQPDGKTELFLVLHYKKFVLVGYFVFLFVFLTYLLYPTYHSSLVILISFIGSLFAVFLFVFMLWVVSKNWIRVIAYEILTEGIYIRHMELNKLLTGLFVSYSNLENPKFDDKNKVIILKFKNKRFLRRFLVCKPDNYKRISEYIKGRLN